MILQIRLNLDIFTVWKKLKNSVVKCEKTFSLVERLKRLMNLNLHIAWWVYDKTKTHLSGKENTASLTLCRVNYPEILLLFSQKGGQDGSEKNRFIFKRIEK